MSRQQKEPLRTITGEEHKSGKGAVSLLVGSGHIKGVPVIETCPGPVIGIGYPYQYY
jgi:hypothetical protein